MARIVLGMGFTHGPMIGCPPDQWTTAFRKGDEGNPLLWFRKRRLSYHELVKARASEGLERYLTAEETRRRHAAVQVAIDELMQVYREVNPDILVIIGNDHQEVFSTVTPAFGVYCSKTHDNGPIGELQLFLPGAYSPDGFYTPQTPHSHPGLPDLGVHVIKQLRDDEFDVAYITETPTQGNHGRKVTPHAFGFLYHHLLKDDVPPSLPIHINTFFPPNQPPMARVFKFGRSLVKAIESWDTDQTVALIASGGWTHFIVDEEFDRKLLDAFTTDVDKLLAIDELYYQSGTSEVKHWAPVALAMSDRGVPMTLTGYVPCYRSLAGNGHGMAFAYWRP